MSDNKKYIILRRDKLPEGALAVLTPDDHTHIVVSDAVVADGVVIRRQDLFASPCLATYASMIAMVANNITDVEQGKELMAIADYFEDQARLAAEEGFKLPDR